MTRKRQADELRDYLERWAKFQVERKSRECEECGCPILPGNAIWVSSKRRVFCCSKCFARGVGGAYLEFDDKGYDKFFDKLKG